MGGALLQCCYSGPLGIMIGLQSLFEKRYVHLIGTHTNVSFTLVLTIESFHFHIQLDKPVQRALYSTRVAHPALAHAQTETSPPRVDSPV